MCKLCNTPKPPVTIRHNTVKTSRLSLFKNIVKDYTGEFPCQSCIVAVPDRGTIERHGGLDGYIISKLFRKYSEKMYSRSCISNARKIFYDKPKEIEKKVSKCIRERSSETGHITYIAAIYRNNTLHRKNFSTLDEAIKYRDNIYLGI